jgi:predicted RNase H-like HicB family nuclease
MPAFGGHRRPSSPLIAVPISKSDEGEERPGRFTSSINFPLCRTGEKRLCMVSGSMKLPPLTAVIEKDEDWFVATCPELGVASQGHSIEEAEAMIKEAVELLLQEASPEEIGRRLN